MKFYISHPIFGKTPEELERSIQDGRELVRSVCPRGAQIVLPMQIRPWCETDLRFVGACLTPGRHEPHSPVHTRQCHMRADLYALLQCTDIVMAPGWEYSQGCVAELNTAIASGINVHLV